ncbi:MAG: bifunctional DNA primase/polymerase [Verrucomicrobiota bacterium]
MIDLDFLAPSPLDAALEACRRGWSVFPLVPNTKKPLLPWREHSTHLAERVRSWSAKYPDCNWGVDCGKSNLAVVDIDLKDGKNGLESLLLLETEHGGKLLRDTFTVTTPTGGKHLYYTGQCRSVNGLGVGLDLKSNGGYVVLYGSTVSGKSYWISNSLPTSKCVGWLIERAGKAAARSPIADSWMTEPDRAEYIAWAVNWLENDAPESIQGQNGDDVLVKRVFMPLRDGGVSKEKAVELILEHYNDSKAFPPWTPEELERKSDNAYRYALSPAGSKTPAALATVAREAFQPIPAESRGTPAPAQAVVGDIPWIRGRDIVELSIPQRRWVLGRRLLRGYITGTFSPGGVGKSNLTYLEALAVATGRKDIAGEVVHQAGPCVLFNAEDGGDELRMRLAAVAKFYGVNLADLDGKKYHPIYLVSGRDLKLRVVGLANDRQSFCADPRAVALLDKMIAETKAVLFVGDPFVRLHDAPENDNVAVDKVAEVFTDFAHRHQISVHLVHHTRKRSAAGGEGDAEMSRGASSFVNAMRLAHTITTMGEDDAKHYGIAQDQRSWYVRVDDAKINLAPPSSEIRWFKKIDVHLSNGEHVGTLQRVTLDAVLKKSQYGHPSEVERAASLLTAGSERPVADLAKAIVETAKDEGRAATTISNSIQKYLKDKGPVTLGDVVLSLVEKPTVPKFWLRLDPAPN